MPLDVLLCDEKLADQKLYTAEPYWKEKAKKICSQLKYKEMEGFRVYNSGVGTSYCDNRILDPWNEEALFINHFLRKYFIKLLVFSGFDVLAKNMQDTSIELHTQNLKLYQILLEKNDNLKKLLSIFSTNNCI